MSKRNHLIFQTPDFSFLEDEHPALGTKKVRTTISNLDIDISTQMVKRILTILNTFKADVDCNLEFTPDGIQIFALYSATTACVFIRLRKHLFTYYSITSDVKPYCLRFNVIAKQLDSLYKFKPKCLRITSTGPDNIVLEGKTDNKSPVKFSLTTQDNLLEKLDISEIHYDFLLRVCAVQLWNILEAMTSTISIRVDCTSRSLIFESRDDTSTIEMSLELDTTTVKQCREYSNVGNFKASYLKKNLSPLAKSTKLASHVLLGLHPTYPLYATYSLCDDFDSGGVTNSEVCMYFSPMVEDTDWSCANSN